MKGGCEEIIIYINTADEMKLMGKRSRGRQKLQWSDCLTEDMKVRKLKEEGGRRKEDGGRRKEEGGRRKEEGGGRREEGRGRREEGGRVRWTL